MGETGTKTIKVPVIGDIIVTEYSKPSETVEDTCALYAISDDGASCGESDLDCKYTKYAKAFQKQLKDGKCADQGYTKETGTKTIKVPVIGNIVVTEYQAKRDGGGHLQPVCDQRRWCIVRPVGPRLQVHEVREGLPETAERWQVC